MLGEMIAVDAEPYLIVERPGFLKLMEVLEPRYKVPCRKVFSERVVPEIYEDLRKKVVYFSSKSSTRLIVFIHLLHSISLRNFLEHVNNMKKILYKDVNIVRMIFCLS